MSQPSGKHSQALQFLAVQHFSLHQPSLFFRLFAPCDVAGDRFDGHRFPPMADEAAADFQGDLLAVAGHDGQFLDRCFLTGQQAAPPPVKDRAMLGGDPVLEATA